MEHLQNVTKQGGIAFLIVHFKQYNEYFLLPFQILDHYWKLQTDKEKGRKSIPYQVFKDKTYIIPFGYQPRLDYLSVVREYLL
jgi:recombination protein U